MVIDPSSGYNKSGVTNASGGAKAKPAAPDAGSAAKAPAGNESDSVSLSSEAHTMARLESAVNNAPDVDEARVASLKQAIENGTYQVDPQAIAEKMLAEDQNW